MQYIGALCYTNTRLAHPLAFLPFSAGARNCVGAQFALLEAKAILVALLRAADWELDSSYVHAPEMAITLRPAEGMPLRIVPWRGTVAA